MSWSSMSDLSEHLAERRKSLELLRVLQGRIRDPNLDQTLSDWRGANLKEAETEFHFRPKTLKETTRLLKGRLRLEQRKQETEILSVWNDLIDPNITRHSQPYRLAKGTLMVKVSSNTALAEIVRFHRKDILTTMQSAYGKSMIRKISFKVG